MSIPFIQCIRPHGRREPTEYESDPETEALAKEVLEFGYRFTVEALPGDLVSLCCEGHDEDIVVEIAQNGPKVDEKVKLVVRKAHRKVVGDS